MTKSELARMTFRATSIIHGVALELGEHLKKVDLDQTEQQKEMAAIMALGAAHEALATLTQTLDPGSYQKIEATSDKTN